MSKRTKRLRPLKIVIGEPGPDDALVCLRVTIPLNRPENLTAACASCGTGIQYHPSSPVGPKRICVRCAADKAPEVEGIRVTQRQLDFVQLVHWPGGTRQ